MSQETTGSHGSSTVSPVIDKQGKQIAQSPSSRHNDSISHPGLNKLVSQPYDFEANKSQFPFTSRNLSEVQTSVNLVRSEGKELLKRFDNDSSDDLRAAEDLYSLCLFEKNRIALIEISILASLVLSLKTKRDEVKEVSARILQLFAQDGAETVMTLKRLNMCGSCLDILCKTTSTTLKIAIVGLIYWMCRVEGSRKEFNDLGCQAVLKDLQMKSKNPLLQKKPRQTLRIVSQTLGNSTPTNWL